MSRRPSAKVPNRAGRSFRPDLSGFAANRLETRFLPGTTSPYPYYYVNQADPYGQLEATSNSGVPVPQGFTGSGIPSDPSGPQSTAVNVASNYSGTLIGTPARENSSGNTDPAQTFVSEQESNTADGSYGGPGTSPAAAGDQPD